MTAARVLPAVPLAALAAANGGYFAGSWGWAALAFSWGAIALLLTGRAQRLGRDGAIVLGGLALLVAWTAASAAWSTADAAFPEAERSLVYLAGVGCALLVARRAQLLGAILAAITIVCAYALATRLFPRGAFDPVAVNRLAQPIGYWNALAIFAVIGLLLALAFAGPYAGAAAVVLAPTLYFTFSRAAWVALAAGLLVALALSSRRLELAARVAALSVAPAAAVALASRSGALTESHPVFARAVHDGRVLALELVALVALGAAAGLLARRIHVSAKLPRVALLPLAAAALAAVVLAHPGRAWHSFAAPPQHVHGSLNARLFTFSGTGRVPFWRAAWSDARRHPVLGSGAGSYERWWLAHRTTPFKVRDAHSLYLETLAELGPLGLALLLVVLGVPLAAAVRARRHPLVPAGAGAYVAYLLHAGVDWDWEVPAVTLAALLVGVALLARDDEPPAARRYGLLVPATACAVVSFAVLAGGLALSQSTSAADAGDWAQAASAARRAARWAPWSAEPWQRLGEAQIASAEPAAARRSLRHALAKDGGDWSIWFDLARAGDTSALARAARLDPLSPEIAELRKELR